MSDDQNVPVESLNQESGSDLSASEEIDSGLAPNSAELLVGAPAPSFWRSLIQKLIPVIALAIFCVALYFIHDLLKRYSYREIVQSVNSIPRHQVLLSLIATVVSYLVLTAYDVVGLKLVGKKISRGKVAFASFIAFALSNNINLANLTGTSVRIRIYSSWGLQPLDVVKVVAFNSLSYWLGFSVMAGLALSFAPLRLPPEYGLSEFAVQMGGVFLLALPLFYVGFASVRRRPFKIRQREIHFPPLLLCLEQIAIASLDWALAALALYFLLPDSNPLSYWQFLSVFAAAQFITLMTNVPGGVGILEGLVIYFVSPDHTVRPDVLGALLVYRCLYYLLPLGISVLLLAGFEIWQKRHLVQASASGSLEWTKYIVPNAAAFVAFIGGVLLLISGATPDDPMRLSTLSFYISWFAIDVSHFVVSLVGAALLITARGLISRSLIAWKTTLALLVIGVVASLTKGLDYPEAVTLSAFVVFLFVSRDEFKRETSFLGETYTRTWIATSLMTMIGALWIGVFAHADMSFEFEALLNSGPDAENSRFLRFAIGAVTTAIALWIVHLRRTHSFARKRADH